MRSAETLCSLFLEPQTSGLAGCLGICGNNHQTTSDIGTYVHVYENVWASICTYRNGGIQLSVDLMKPAKINLKVSILQLAGGNRSKANSKLIYSQHFWRLQPSS